MTIPICHGVRRIRTQNITDCSRENVFFFKHYYCKWHESFMWYADPNTLLIFVELLTIIVETLHNVRSKGL